MPEVPGAGGCISEMPPTIATTLALNNSHLLTKAPGARRSRFGKPVAHADLEVHSTSLTNDGRFEGGDEHEQFGDQSRETQGQRSGSAIVHHWLFVCGKKRPARNRPNRKDLDG